MKGNGKKIDLSGGGGRRRHPPAKRVKTEAAAPAAAASRGKGQIELELGLSTNGLFGVDPAKAIKLERSASGYGPSGAVARGGHAPPMRTTSVPPGFGGRVEMERIRGDPSGNGKAPMMYSPDGRELNGDGNGGANVQNRGISAEASPAAANSLSEKKKLLTNALLNMPNVTVSGARPNNIRVEGILYRYRKAEELKIVCVCHGLFLTPAEFVKHAGGGDVDDPLKYIVVNPSPMFPV